MAVEGQLYAPGVGADPSDDVFEALLGKYVDSPGAPLFDKLVADGKLEGLERGVFAYYLAIQEYRTPRMRDTVRGFMSQVINDVMQMHAADPEVMRRSMVEAGVVVTEDQAAHIAEGIKTGGIVAEATNACWLEMSRMAEELAETILALDWAVAVAPTGFSFVTSDSPIVKVLTDPTVPTRFQGGWLSPSAESTIALDPGHSLVLRSSGPTGFLKPPLPWAADVNARTCFQAHRFVISREKDESIQAIVEKYPVT